MAISFKCGGCAKQYSVGDQLAGKKAQCKKCGQVMTIPRIAASHEPDLLNDHGDPSNPGNKANAETVAGSLIASPIETLAGRGASIAGRSVSGQSVAGKSVSGRSTSGRSMTGASSAGTHRAPPPQPAYAPEPESDDGPSLESLKHVEQSQHDAFEVKGGTQQTLRRGRGPALKNRAPMEPYSMLLIVLMLAALGYSAYAYMSAAAAAVPADAIDQVGKPTMAAFASRGVMFVLGLAVVGPLVMAAWVGACKLVNYRNPDNILVRSMGLAALPVIAIAVADAVPALHGNGPLLALASVPLGYLLLQFVHNQRPALAGVAAGLAVIGGGIGVGIASAVAGQVEASMRPAYDHKVQVAIDDAKTKQNAPAKAVDGPKAPVVDTAAADGAVAAVRAKIDALALSLTNAQQTREPLATAAAAAAADLAAGQQKFADRQEWKDLSSQLAAAKEKIAGFPTATPPAELAEAPPAGSDWSVPAGRKEVSVFGFNFTPPADAVVDLDSRDTAGGTMTWTLDNGRTSLSITRQTAASPKQQRPWVAPAFVADAAHGTVSVVADGTPKVEYGTIAGVPATKVGVDAGANPRLVYALHQGGTWTVCTVTPATGSDAMQQAVQSLHPRSPGEAELDPMPSSALIAAFDADPSRAEKVIGLLRQKPNAEDAVARAIGFAPDDATLMKYAPLLVATATEKSSHTLWKLAGSCTPVGDQAREALRAIEPKAADDIAFAEMDVKSGNPTQISKGLSAIGNADFDKSRQPQVCKALGTSIDDGSLMRSDPKKAEAVLGKWMDRELSTKVVAMLDRPGDRLTAMRVLASTGDRKYVQPIFNKVVLDSSAVVDALIAMGAPAEPEVDRMITATPELMATPVALKAALAVLNEIGTQRSISALQTISSKSGDPDARDQARALILRIKEASKTASAKPKK